MPDTVKEMMSAYVVGCMDLRNLQQFIQFLDEGNYIPLEELGELQNIASLIPILLERTSPPASLQNDIFSQIPEDEIPEREKSQKPKKKVNFSKILEESSEDIPDEDIPIPDDISFTSLNRTEIVEDIADKVEEEIYASRKLPKRSERKAHTFSGDFENRETKSPYPHVKIKDPSNEKQETKTLTYETDVKGNTELTENKDGEIEKTESNENNNHEEVVTEFNDTKSEEITTKNFQCSKCKIWKFLTILFALLSSIFVYLYFTEKSTHKEEIDTLQNELKTKKAEIEEKSSFINQNLPLIEIFDIKDLVFVELTSTYANGKTRARLILSPGSKRGVLQFIAPPKIDKKISLQLWLVNKGQSYSLGVFNPTPDKKFYVLGKIPSIPFDEIDLFRITIEPHGGSEFPQGKTIYFGSFKFK